jgi:hypothetical protein
MLTINAGEGHLRRDFIPALTFQMDGTSAAPSYPDSWAACNGHRPEPVSTVLLNACPAITTQDSRIASQCVTPFA